MQLVMEAAVLWCSQNRPALAVWITLDRFQNLARVVAEATNEINGESDWAAQIVFLRSDDGAQYLKLLERKPNTRSEKLPECCKNLLRLNLVR